MEANTISAGNQHFLRYFRSKEAKFRPRGHDYRPRGRPFSARLTDAHIRSYAACFAEDGYAPWAVVPETEQRAINQAA